MHVDHIGLSVGDLDAQVDWYRTTFGFDASQLYEVPVIGLRIRFVFGPDQLAIELLERQGSTHRPPASSAQEELLSQGWGHLCFRVDDLQAEFDRLVAAGAGVVSGPADAPEKGSRFAYITDPEGNFIELVSREGGRTHE